ncbi:MAG TPA: hypothetical protein VKU00_20040 [Chthonomonadaceae bacterium]|nr:hypothetical protein [Chthonomonadaceae bacterium]
MNWLHEIGWGWGVLGFLTLCCGGAMVTSMVENWNKTRVELAKLRAKQKGSEGLERELAAMRSELEALRKQMTDLRDTTTQYDLSFDTALQTMEKRMAFLERKTHVSEAETQNVTLRGR